MINKMPVVGKRYKLKNRNMIVRVLPIVTVVEEGVGGTIEYGVEVFNSIYKELPEDNLQEKQEARINQEQLPEVGRFYRRFDSTGAWECQDITIERTPNGKRFARMWAVGANKPEEEEFDLKKGFWKYFELIPYETPLPVKKEVSEVERALEELKYHAQIQHYFDKEAALEDIKRAAKALINALEKERSERAVMSKPEPKIDMKEECVEPVSIWKVAKEEIYRCNFSSYQIWLYEIFINSFEQMQKDIKKLKRK